MNKAAIILDTLRSVGVTTDDMLERADRDAAQLRGEVIGATRSGMAVEGVLKQVDRDVGEGSLTVEQAAAIKAYLVKAHAAVNQLVRISESAQLSARGGAQALRGVVDMLKKRHDAEASKVARRDRLHLRLPAAAGGRVKLTIKERRLAEERKEAPP